MKKTTIKQILFIFALLMGTMNAWGDPVDLTARTPNGAISVRTCSEQHQNEP